VLRGGSCQSISPLFVLMKREECRGQLRFAAPQFHGLRHCSARERRTAIRKRNRPALTSGIRTAAPASFSAWQTTLRTIFSPQQ